MSLTPICSSLSILLNHDDELRLVLEYIGDKKTLSALFLASKELQRAVVDAQVTRLRCFCLPTMIFQVDQDIRAFYEKNQTRFINIATQEEERDPHFQYDRTKLEVATSELNSIIKIETDIPNGPFVDRRLTPEFIKKYMYCCEIAPEGKLVQLFSLFKEDLIDALSEHPDEVIDSIHMPSYPSLLTADQCDKHRTICDLHTCLSEAKKRECGDIYLKPVYATISQGKPSAFHSPLSLSSFFVSTQVTSTRSGNWQAFGVPRRLLGTIPSLSELFPASLFNGIKEGDVLTFALQDVTIRLRAVQLIHSYGYSGSFEKLFRLIMDEKSVNWISSSQSDAAINSENEKIVNFYQKSPLCDEITNNTILRRSFIEQFEID